MKLILLLITLSFCLNSISQEAKVQMQSNKIKTPDKFIYIAKPKLDKTTPEYEKSIEKVILTSVLKTNQFKLLFSKATNFKDTKLRVYEIRSWVEPNPYNEGFYNLKLALHNPKIDKTVRSLKAKNIKGIRILHQFRLMAFRLIMGKKYTAKNKKALDRLEANDPKINPKTKKKIPVNKKKKINKKKEKKKYDVDMSNKSSAPKEDEPEAEIVNYREKIYNLSFGILTQSISSVGEFLDVENVFPFYYFGMVVNIKSLNPGDYIVLDGTYGMPTSNETYEVPSIMTAGAMYDLYVRMLNLRVLGGGEYEQTHFANLPALNEGIQVGTLDILWARIGIEKEFKLFGKYVLAYANFGKSVFAQTSFGSSGESTVSGIYLKSFIGLEIWNDFHLGIQTANYKISVVGDSAINNHDNRIAFSIYYPFDHKIFQ